MKNVNIKTIIGIILLVAAFICLGDSFKDLIIDKTKRSMEIVEDIAKESQKEKYYNLTNQLCEIVEKDYPCGIYYSSCYFPIGNTIIDCSEYNLALYTPALSCIKFVDYNIKSLEIKRKESFTDVNIAKIILKDC